MFIKIQEMVKESSGKPGCDVMCMYIYERNNLFEKQRLTCPNRPNWCGLIPEELSYGYSCNEGFELGRKARMQYLCGCNLIRRT